MKKALVFLLMMAVLFLFGCSRQDSPLAPDNDVLNADDQQTQSLSAQLTSAHLHVYVGFANGQPVDVHRITADWLPDSTTWTSFGAAFAPDVEGSFTADGNGWRTVDVTGLVQGWVADNYANYGCLLGQSAGVIRPAVISSSEAGSVGPFLELCYSASGGVVCDTVPASADLFIDEADPGGVHDGTSVLMVGSMPTPGTTKQALVRFDLPDALFEAETSTLGGRVWEDENQDGLRQPGEPARAGMTVNLLACDETALAQTVTDLTGSYRFDSVTAGDYLLEFVAPDGYLFSPADRDAADTLDSDVDPATGRTACFALAEGVHELNWDAGVFIEEVVVDDSGCTRPWRYWLRHSGWRKNDDKLTPLLPIWLGDENGEKSILVETGREARAVLFMCRYGRPWNSVTRLYAQLLTAKLNIAAGALPDDVAETIDQADGFLAEYSWKDWRRCRRQPEYPVKEWIRTLRKYNNGEIGPGRCE